MLAVFWVLGINKTIKPIQDMSWRSWKKLLTTAECDGEAFTENRKTELGETDLKFITQW